MDIDVRASSLSSTLTSSSISSLRRPTAALLAQTTVAPGAAAADAEMQTAAQQQPPQMNVDVGALTSTHSTAARVSGLNTVSALQKRANEHISVLYAAKPSTLLSAVVPEADDNHCFWCGGDVNRPYDADALGTMGFVYNALCDELLCSPACLYSAACDQVPAERPDLVAAIQRILHGQYGNRIFRCDWCTGGIAHVHNAEALKEFLPELYRALANRKFCSASCLYSNACSFVPEERTDLRQIIYTTLNKTPSEQILLHSGRPPVLRRELIGSEPQ